jgi:hypothetical protein
MLYMYIQYLPVPFTRALAVCSYVSNVDGDPKC